MNELNESIISVTSSLSSPSRSTNIQEETKILPYREYCKKNKKGIAIFEIVGWIHKQRNMNSRYDTCPEDYWVSKYLCLNIEDPNELFDELQRYYIENLDYFKNIMVLNRHFNSNEILRSIEDKVYIINVLRQNNIILELKNNHLLLKQNDEIIFKFNDWNKLAFFIQRY